MKYGQVHAVHHSSKMFALSCVLVPAPIYTHCFKKRGVELFVITSSTVNNRFWKLFKRWKQQWIIYRIMQHFRCILKTSQYYRPCETWKFKNVAIALPLLDDKAVNSGQHF